MSIGALPVILPVHFARFGEAVRFRTVPGTKLDSATVGAVVAFQVDQWEPSKETYWSVLLQGIASEVTEEQQPASLRSLDIKPWGNSSRLVQVDATNISGRRFKIAGEGPQVELPQPPPVAEPPSL